MLLIYFWPVGLGEQNKRESSGVGKAEAMGQRGEEGLDDQGNLRVDLRELSRVLTKFKLLPKALCRAERSHSQKVLHVSQD